MATAVTHVVAVKEHAVYAFDVLHHSLTKARGAPPAPNFDISHSTPLFVTLYKSVGREKELRGCIGTLSPVNHGRIGDYALKSALEDGRFEPVQASELPALTLSVSLLVRYEAAAHPEDWTVGVHGIIFEFTADGRRFSATYLPEVAHEQGWTQREAVLSLVRKAGCRRAVTDYSALSDVRTTRYQSSKVSLTYEEWRTLRSC